MKKPGNVQITTEQLVEAQTVVLKAMTPLFMAMSPQALQDRIIGNRDLFSNLKRAFLRMPKVLSRIGEFTVDSTTSDDFKVFQERDVFGRKRARAWPEFEKSILTHANVLPDAKPLRIVVYRMQCAAIDEEIVAELTAYQFSAAEAARCIAHVLNHYSDGDDLAKWILGESNNILYTPSGTAFVRWDTLDRHWCCFMAGMNAWEWHKDARIFALEG